MFVRSFFSLNVYFFKLTIFFIRRLPSSQHFHEAAYLADERQDLLTAINSFLDCSIVLPPSEVGGDELLHSVARFQREMLRKRHEQEVKLQAKEPKSPEDEGTRQRDGWKHTCALLKQAFSLIFIVKVFQMFPCVPLSSTFAPVETTRRSSPEDGPLVRRRHPRRSEPLPQIH